MTVAVFTLAHQPGIELHVPFTRSSPGTICGRATYVYSRLDAGTTKSMASRVKGKKNTLPQLSSENIKKGCLQLVLRTKFEPQNLTERTQRHRVVDLLIPEEISTPCTPREPVHVKVGFGLRESQFMSRGSSLSPIALSIIIRRDNIGTRNGSVYSTINRISSRI